MAPGTAALELFLDEVQTFTAEFEQELRSSDQRVLETAAGTLSLKRPNRFLWSYEAPIEQLVIADGEQLWMYDVDLAQVTVTPLEPGDAASPAMLLSGEQNVRDSFDIVDDFALDGQDWVRLSPKPGGADFRSVLIGFRDGLPAELELVDGLDQTTSIVFSEIAVNTGLSDSVFEFEPPAGVDVIGGEG
ncbi:outer membrane lipoprotein chaperone LolA [Candidatus Rariloculus sp.]|uniref:outer membrane lipoprotein chaperone LolA n=1 Tax=Candidatus Rariloculus sp. TaxID=3101265 RepID=UPI003D0A38F7